MAISPVLAQVHYTMEIRKNFAKIIQGCGHTMYALIKELNLNLDMKMMK